eukprot:m.19265 g.19265  ORF g.19265 m.19265 type:complete len:80 (+) comp8004_c0_seq1:1958-2197(+)
MCTRKQASQKQCAHYPMHFAWTAGFSLFCFDVLLLHLLHPFTCSIWLATSSLVFNLTCRSCYGKHHTPVELEIGLATAT